VWLLSSQILPNLKVEGSSPSFGYSYHTLLAISFLLVLRDVSGMVVEGEDLFLYFFAWWKLGFGGQVGF
jgi:hypothetical protein